MALLVLAALGAGACEHAASPAPSRARRAERPGARIGMAELHQTGGVPPGWQFTVPPGDVEAGRRAFAHLGCPSCHHVTGEPFSTEQSGIGPDLSGMGSHHPAEYFAESIVNPDAVLVEGPGYIGADGRSIMPLYPDLSVAQLADLVAYLKSLRAGGAAEMMAALPVRRPSEVPAPPERPASVFYLQVYDVEAGKLASFEEWFRTEGTRAFLAYDGLVGVDTWVDVTREGPALATVLAFRDDASLTRFLDDPAAGTLGAKFDEFIGPHAHRVFRRPPLYRADTLSTSR